MDEAALLKVEVNEFGKGGRADQARRGKWGSEKKKNLNLKN